MTRRLPATEAGVEEAAALLLAGRLVAFPTETVYGLGGRADDPDAVARIYQAKQRPSANPLICHYADAAAAVGEVAFPPLARQLAAQFWPGPLTLVLPRQPGARIAAGVAPEGGLAVRIPAAPLARRLLASCGVPIAAPSANPSGQISPTTAEHVLAGLGGRIDAVLDGGPCAVGLESTVVDCLGGRPAMLRAGGVSRERLEAAVGVLALPGHGAEARSPGQLTSHYAPRLPLRLGAVDCVPEEALLAFGLPAGAPGLMFQLSAARDLDEAAARLFEGLWFLDREGRALGLAGIAAMAVPMVGIGVAINDRLTRAAH